METMAAIRSRRSIRVFKEDEVEKDKILTLVEAGMYAPTACDQQEWQFIVLDDRQVLDAIPMFHPYSQMLHQAPLAIVVCADRRLETLEGYWVQDCAAATQNILLAARDVGLGSCWLAIYPEEDRVQKMRELLQLPAEVTPLNVIAVGYADEEKEPVQRYKPERVHWNKW